MRNVLPLVKYKKESENWKEQVSSHVVNELNKLMKEPLNFSTIEQFIQVANKISMQMMKSIDACLVRQNPEIEIAISYISHFNSEI